MIFLTVKHIIFWSENNNFSSNIKVIKPVHIHVICYTKIKKNKKFVSNIHNHNFIESYTDHITLLNVIYGVLKTKIICNK